MSQLSFTLILLCNGILLYYFQLSSWNYYNSDLPLCVFLLLPYWLKQYHFPWFSLLEGKFERAVMWRQFLRFKKKLNLEQKSRPLQVLIFYWIVYPLSRLTLDVNYIMFIIQYCTLVLSVERPNEFTIGIKIPSLTHWTYAQMDFSFTKLYTIV